MIGKASLFAVASVISMTAVPSVAHAATTITFDGVNGTFGNTTPGPNTKFKDVFTFSTPLPGKISIDWTTFWGASRTNLKAVVTLNGVLLAGTDTNTPTGLLKVRSLTDLLVTPGVQTIVVAGSAAQNSSYSGTLSFTAGVPEPTVWALMTLGIGCIAFAIRHRRRPVGKFAFA